MTQPLKALPVLDEDLDSIPGNHIRKLTNTRTPIPGDLIPVSGICRHLHIHGAHKAM